MLRKTIRNSNYKNAWRHFYPEGNGKSLKGHQLHHKDHTLKYRDPVRYAEWRLEDLEMLTFSEHMKIHRKDIHQVMTSERNNKISIANTGKTRTQEQKEAYSLAQKKRFAEKGCPLVGRSRSEETKAKIAASLKGHSISAETRKKISEANTKRMVK